MTPESSSFAVTRGSNVLRVKPNRLFDGHEKSSLSTKDAGRGVVTKDAKEDVPVRGIEPRPPR
jgi:hypothetical protein